MQSHTWKYVYTHTHHWCSCMAQHTAYFYRRNICATHNTSLLFSLSYLWTPFFFFFCSLSKLNTQFLMVLLCFFYICVIMLLAFLVFCLIFFLIRRFSINRLKSENKDLLFCHCWELKRVFFFLLLLLSSHLSSSLFLNRSLSLFHVSLSYSLFFFLPSFFFHFPIFCPHLSPVLCTCPRLCEFW